MDRSKERARRTWWTIGLAIGSLLTSFLLEFAGWFTAGAVVAWGGGLGVLLMAWRWRITSPPGVFALLAVVVVLCGLAVRMLDYLAFL